MTKREEIKQAAVAMAQESGLINLSRASLCERVEIAEGSFPHYVGCGFREFFEEIRQLVDEKKIHPITRKRAASPELRKAAIVASAANLARREGYREITRTAVAEEAGVSDGLIYRYFGTMKQLKRAVMRYAIEGEILEIIAQGLAAGDPHAQGAPEELKRAAAASLTSE